MTVYTLKQLSDIGVISQQLKRVLVLLGCSTSKDMIELAKDWIKVDYIEKSHKLKDELFKAVSDVKELDNILPEFVASAKTNKEPPKKVSDKKFNKRTFKVGDYTEHLLEQSSTPIKIDDLLQKIRYYLPGTYIESIRANLNGDPKGRFIFFLDGYVGLKRKEYDKRFQVYSVENKKIQYAEQRIMEFLSFMEEKHRSPQPHGLEAEESLYRWYLDFTKSTAKELAKLRADFKQYLKEYDQWMFTPFEYSYKRNCDQVKWYVDENLELPTQEDEPELAAWFNSQLECYEKHKDKRKKMFIDLMAYLEDYGMHFYDAKSAKGKAAKKEKREVAKKVEETPLDKYSRLFDSMKERKNDKTYLTQKALLLIAIGNLIQNENIRSNEIKLTNDLLMEFADVCIDVMGTASSFNIAIPFYYLGNESFWSLIPQMWMACEDSGEVEPTYDYIEQNYSCSIIDQDLFELLADEKDYATFKKQLIEDIIEERKSLESQADDVNTSESNNGDEISTTTDNVSSAYDEVVNEERKLDEDGIEHVYVDIPSAEPYKEIEVPLQETDDDDFEEEPIDKNKLETVFDNKSTSYKYFWFMAILSLTKSQRNRIIRYDDILIRMAAIAWPIVIGDNIEFGEKDMMPKYLNNIQKKTFIIEAASSNVVESNLTMFYDRGIKDILKPLLNNVPYRFLSPWIKYTNNEDVIEKSKSESIKAPYAIFPDSIVINTEWFSYFTTHYDELCSFTLDSFIKYAKGFNNNLKLVKLMSSGWGIK